MSLGIRIVSRLAVSLLLVISLSLLALADTIRLKDGSIIKGRIVGFAGGKFTVAIGEGSRLKQLTFLATEIDSIVFDSPVDKPQNSAGNRSVTDGKIVNASSTTTTPPQRAVTDNSVRTNGSATIGSGIPSQRKAENQDKPVNTKTTENKTLANPRASKADPISWNVKVLADNTANGWTNTGWVVKKGQRIHITGDGQVSLGKGKTSPASGVGDIQDDLKLLKNVPTGALIAVIGDDNNDFIYIGAEREFTATRDGALFLGINEGSLEDNSGSFNVKVEILPGSED